MVGGGDKVNKEYREKLLRDVMHEAILREYGRADMRQPLNLKRYFLEYSRDTRKNHAILLAISKNGKLLERFFIPLNRTSVTAKLETVIKYSLPRSTAFVATSSAVSSPGTYKDELDFMRRAYAASKEAGITYLDHLAVSGHDSLFLLDEYKRAFSTRTESKK